MTQEVLIGLTQRQYKIADWAIDPMYDYFSEQFREGEMDHMPDLPGLRKGVLEMVLPLDSDVIGDFMYRVTVQFVDMMNEECRGFPATHIQTADGTIIRNIEGERIRREECKEAKADATSARQLGRKIASVAKRHHIEYFVG
jgi:hypothetical protein